MNEETNKLFYELLHDSQFIDTILRERTKKGHSLFSKYRLQKYLKNQFLHETIEIEALHLHLIFHLFNKVMPSIYFQKQFKFCNGHTLQTFETLIKSDVPELHKENLEYLNEHRVYTACCGLGFSGVHISLCHLCYKEILIKLLIRNYSYKSNKQPTKSRGDIMKHAYKNNKLEIRYFYDDTELAKISDDEFIELMLVVRQNIKRLKKLSKKLNSNSLANQVAIAKEDLTALNALFEIRK